MNIDKMRRSAEAREFRRFFVGLMVEEDTLSQENTLGRLNDALFEELEALRSVDPSNKDALAAEVERSKAIEGIAKTVIDNASMVLTATRMRAEYTKSMSVPKMLEG